MNLTVRTTFIKNCVFRIDENTRMLKIALSSITEEELWKKPNNHLNSIGNLVLHLCGNITQYVIAPLGNLEDQRDRTLEFSTTGGYSKQELIEKLDRVLLKAKATIARVSEATLLKEKEVQGFQFSGVGLIIHVVEHYSYHTGQIAFWVKLLKNKDLGFYESFDLNKKNE
ncbi:MAG: hypothetical protein CMC74_01425 [Flavobacteriaceae bacterium]|nr:hypothetical protein [Flavobacteriaceae bacterium]|tara:strand:+ start:26834 stop:27343 length:510 start_codon:yes stop_codon:yes gene_type:complete